MREMRGESGRGEERRDERRGWHEWDRGWSKTKNARNSNSRSQRKCGLGSPKSPQKDPVLVALELDFWFPELIESQHDIFGHCIYYNC